MNADSIADLTHLLQARLTKNPVEEPQRTQRAPRELCRCALSVRQDVFAFCLMPWRSWHSWRFNIVASHAFLIVVRHKSSRGHEDELDALLLKEHAKVPHFFR